MSVQRRMVCWPCRALAGCLALWLHSVSAAHALALQVPSPDGPLIVNNDLGSVVVQPPASQIVISGASNLLSPFQINLDWNGASAGLGTGPGGSTEAAFTSAKATWQSIITGWKQDAGLSGVTINVTLGNIDGVGGILGSAGPTNGISTANYLYSSAGSMNFDTSDIPGLGSAFQSVVLHEMGHVLGIGTLWSASFATGGAVVGRQELYVNNSGQYTGARGLAAYNAEFSQVGVSVPVELGGGSGTANGHWNEVNGGGVNTGIVSNITFKDFQDELMTGWLGPNPIFISQLTIQSMQDLGYNVVPEPSSLLLALIGFAAVAQMRRRK